VTTHGRERLEGFFPELDVLYFSRGEKKIFENSRYFVPNFMNN
jgi:hypothetical protein